MLVVLASRHDCHANELVERWTADDAALLSCEDLFSPGWRYYPSDLANSRAVVGGRVVPVVAFRGVLSLRPAVVIEELSAISAADREYVATEMNAFLIAFLSSLPCRVLNRPTPTCLSGPNWRAEQWTLAAARAGIPIAPTHRHVPPSPETRRDSSCEDSVEAIVVGGRCLGLVDQSLACHAHELARAVGVELLGVWFSHSRGGARFIGANLWPDVTRADVADAIRTYFLGE